MATACGLFGKTQSRRDFVSVNVPRRFLALWEPWMQQGLAKSRLDLGEAWMPLFLTAPLWFFRLGRRHCGVEAVGAMIPSMDGAGRCFPLTLVAFGDEEASLLIDDDAQDPWFAEIGRWLLSTLDPAATFETLVRGLEQLPRPAEGATASAARTDGISHWWTEGGEDREPDRIEVDGLPAPAMMTRMIGKSAALSGAPGRDGSSS